MGQLGYWCGELFARHRLTEAILGELVVKSGVAVHILGGRAKAGVQHVGSEAGIGEFGIWHSHNLSHVRRFVSRCRRGPTRGFRGCSIGTVTSTSSVLQVGSAHRVVTSSNR